jgi:hypothetical protein
MALAVAISVTASVGCGALRSTIDAGFWWDDPPFVLSTDDAIKIGGPLTDAELAAIKHLSASEVRRAFASLSINVTSDRTAFWRVAVVGTPITMSRNRTTYPFSAAGASRVFGPLGGSGSVAFAILAHNAIAYAPPGATRTQVVDGIGRGIGRAAVHELAHQALGINNVTHIDNRTDTSSYEYASADRQEQYYGDLRWTTAWEVLDGKFGK